MAGSDLRQGNCGRSLADRALTLAGLLQWKWSSYRRKLKRSTVPVDAAIELLAAELGERLGLRRKFRIVVTTEPIGPAVFGLLRPTVVLPQSVVAGKTPQQIEPILAHELVHLRRGDMYWGVVQLAVEVLWWFHPLVWWANRTMCHERERCCDEEVVAGLKYRPAAYARCLLDVLDSERNWRPMLAVPGVRFMEVTQKRLEDIMNRSSRFHAKTPRWTWGVLAMAMLVVLPGRAIVLAKNEKPLSTKETKETKNAAGAGKAEVIGAHGNRAPMLAEIAKANEAAWAAIRSMDVEYTRTEQIVSEKRPRQSESTGRWLKDGNRERLRQNTMITCQLEGGKTSSGFQYDEYYLDGTTVRHVQERDRKSSDRGTLSVVDPKPRDGLVGYIYKGPRTVARGDCPISEPEVLRYFRCRYDDPPLTLAEIIAAWKVTLQGKTTTDAKETLWRLHAESPGREFFLVRPALTSTST